jgi:hypothetical protein
MILSKNMYTVLVLTFMISLMCCCTSSRLVDIWNDPVYQVLPLRKMMVIAVRKDATNRRIWEDAFSSELAKHDMAATSSYRIFPNAPPDTNQVIASVESDGFDGILIILNLPSDTTSYHVNGYKTIENSNYFPLNLNQKAHYVYREYPFTDQDVHYISYWQRYRTCYREIEHPGYIDTTTTDVRAIDVTTTGKNGRLIWSATCRTPDPRSVMDVQISIARLVLKELTMRNIAGSRK